ncbi:hypothetical protein R3P38DRAFT_827146 [Favolaschia claudopus]|uniref:C2H2-type domain-containing protein n=1 Tax=Favolaschia claudopus TaxID=2862362 RepID=A0AAW0BZQ0_9AGAR
MYPVHIALAASTSRSSSDIEGGLVVDKTRPNALLSPTNNGIRVIQLVEMPAPPRRSPPSSASASTMSSSGYSSSSSSSMDVDAEELDEDLDEDCDSYCSSAAEEEDDEEEAFAREAEESKMRRIVNWRNDIDCSSTLHHSLSTSPITPRPQLVPPPLSLSPTTPTRNSSRKRSASASSSFSGFSLPCSKRSRTSSVYCTAGPSESSRVVDTLPTEFTPQAARHVPAPLFLAPPSPTNLARRHTSPRHQRNLSSPSAHLAAPPASLSAPALVSPTTPTPDLHRALSMTSSASPREAVCSACDRAFTSVRAFRVHALRDSDADASAACEAAVAYAQEAGRSP